MSCGHQGGQHLRLVLQQHLGHRLALARAANDEPVASGSDFESRVPGFGEKG